MSRSRRVEQGIRLALLGGAAIALIGCESIRDAAGITKSPTKPPRKPLVNHPLNTNTLLT